MEDLGRLHLKGVVLGLVFSWMVGRPCSCCAQRRYIRGEAALEIPEIGAQTAETSSILPFLCARGKQCPSLVALLANPMYLPRSLDKRARPITYARLSLVLSYWYKSSWSLTAAA